MQGTADITKAILSLVADRRGLDFSDYRLEAIERGIAARAASMSTGDAAAYLGLLLSQPGEVDRLLEALVVPVTGFFRDLAVFAALQQRVLPDLVARAGERDPVRAWVAGTASGEEAWSLAMLLDRACNGGPPFEVVASDIDARSLAVARTGTYSVEAAAAVPPELRKRFLCERDRETLVVADSLKERVHFGWHDVMGPSLAPKEAIVASFQLVSFRNVLIYFDRRLQQKALERFHSVLEPGGALVLGNVETLPAGIEPSFDVYPGCDPRLRIFTPRSSR